MPDAVLAVGFLVLLVTEIVPNPDMTPHVPLVARSVPMTVPLAWRRALPGRGRGDGVLGHLVVSLVATGPFSPQLAILPVLVALYSAASLDAGSASRSSPAWSRPS